MSTRQNRPLWQCFGRGGLVWLMVGAMTGWAGEVRLLDGVAARVNERVVTVGDVLGMVTPVERQLAGKYTGEDLRVRLKAAYIEARNSLVDRNLVVAAYEREERKLPDWVVEERITEIVQDSFGGDREKLMTALAETQMTLEEWRELMKEQVIVSYMRSLKIDQNVKVSAQAVRDAYDLDPDRFRAPAQAHLRMLMLEKQGDEAAQAAQRAKVDAWRVALTNGADFADVARANLRGAEADKGGDRGWMDLSMLRPELAAALQGLPVGGISPVVETSGELYLAKVEAWRTAEGSGFEEVRGRIERELRQQESKRLFATWIQTLKRDHYVSVADLCPF